MFRFRANLPALAALVAATARTRASGTNPKAASCNSATKPAPTRPTPTSCISDAPSIACLRCRRQGRAETLQCRPPERYRLGQVGENLSVFGLEREHRLEHQLHGLAVESGDEVDNPIW